MKFLILGTLAALLCFYAYTEDNQESKSYQNDLQDQQIQQDIKQEKVQQTQQKKDQNQTHNNQILDKSHAEKQDLSKKGVFKKENQQKKDRSVWQRRSSTAPKEQKNIKKINGSDQNTNKLNEIKRLSLSLQPGPTRNGIKNPAKVQIKDNNKKNEKLNQKVPETVMKNNKKFKNERVNTNGRDKSQFYESQNKGTNNKYERLNLNILNGKKNSRKLNNANRKNQKI